MGAKATHPPRARAGLIETLSAFVDIQTGVKKAVDTGSILLLVDFQANHTFSDEQVEWFKAGSALNIVRQKVAAEQRS